MMGKQSEFKDIQIDQNEPKYSDMEEFEFDDEAFFDEYTKHSRETNKRCNDARRKIEKLREERELENRLSECYRRK